MCIKEFMHLIFKIRKFSWIFVYSSFWIEFILWSLSDWHFDEIHYKIVNNRWYFSFIICSYATMIWNSGDKFRNCDINLLKYWFGCGNNFESRIQIKGFGIQLFYFLTVLAYQISINRQDSWINSLSTQCCNHFLSNI